MPKNDFYNKSGGLTVYGLSCGYIERIGYDHGAVTMWREHEVYHVKRTSRFIDGRAIQEAWLVFNKVGDARRAYRHQVSILKNQ